MTNHPITTIFDLMDNPSPSCPNKRGFIKSPMNYIGGKYRILKQLIPLFPDNIHTFIDLFSGGANVGINVEAQKHIFNDMNYKVNEIFRLFALHSSDEIIQKIKKIIHESNLSKENETAFLDFRKKYNQSQNPLDLYILTSFSYNYQIRFNNSMEFNNPFGRNRSHFSENMEKNLKNFIDRLHNIDATFVDGSFHEFDFSKTTKEDFVYLDPPYLITTGNYNDGNRGFKNWGEKEENRMYDLLKDLNEKGVRYALSNVTEHKGRTNDILKAFIKENPVYVTPIDFHYDNASYNTQNKGSQEVVITNYDPQKL